MAQHSKQLLNFRLIDIGFKRVAQRAAVMIQSSVRFVVDLFTFVSCPFGNEARLDTHVSISSIPHNIPYGAPHGIQYVCNMLTYLRDMCWTCRTFVGHA